MLDGLGLTPSATRRQVSALSKLTPTDLLALGRNSIFDLVKFYLYLIFGGEQKLILGNDEGKITILSAYLQAAHLFDSF